MKHLYTLTGNLLAETTGSYNTVEWERTHRALDEVFQVGGKGINVAKMAQRLGIFSTAVCFPGGHTGNRCLAWLETQAFAARGFRQATETRAGWVVRAGGRETTFLGRDRNLEEEPWAEAMHFLEHNLRAGDMVAICGSLPGWRPELAEPLKRLLRKVAGDVFVAVDTYGDPLADLAECPVDLVKINHDELEQFRAGSNRDQDVAKTLRDFHQIMPNVRNWVITGGGSALTAIDEAGQLFRMAPPAVEVVSPVGCGDVLLAGLIDGLARRGDGLEEALRKAIPLAAANAASPGIADFELSPEA